MIQRLFALLSTIALLGLSTPAARAQDDATLAPVRATYNDMLQLFYRPVAPADLLRGGWDQLQTDAVRRGAAPPDPLPTDLSDDPDAAFAVFSTAFQSYVAGLGQAEPPDMAALAVAAGMADSVQEGHTHLLPPSIYQRFLNTVGGGQQAIGLGIRLGGNPSGLITAVAPQSPAERAGLRPGDVIVGADGQDLSHADLPSLSAALAGSEGSTANLSIDRGQGTQPISVTRGAYYFPPLEARVLPDNVGYLRLADFVVAGTSLPNGSELLAGLDKSLDDFDAQNVRGIVLDLRDNGGGSVETADELLGRFLPENVRSVYEFDQRGHQTYELASGRQHPRQLPMAVLVNGASASASEVTAAALRESQRAVIVGQQTAGAVASSELLPLPGGGALQVAVAAAATAGAHTDLDTVGVTPDVASADTRSVDDYRAGHDPQLDAAVQALATAPAPPAYQTTLTALAAADLDRLLEPVLPAEDTVPTNDRLVKTGRWQRMDFLHPNEMIDQNGGAPDPIALQQVIRGRGYQGTVVATYGASAGDLPAASVSADLYAAPEGAHDATVTNDLPFLLEPADAPLSLGDETVAYRGTWLAQGTSSITWRRGRVVLTVTYSDVPGLERPATLAALAQQVDALAQNLSIP